MLIAVLTSTCWNTIGYEREKEGLGFCLGERKRKVKSENLIYKGYRSDPPFLHSAPDFPVHAESQRQNVSPLVICRPRPSLPPHHPLPPTLHCPKSWILKEREECPLLYHFFFAWSLISFKSWDYGPELVHMAAFIGMDQQECGGGEWGRPGLRVRDLGVSLISCAERG